MKKMKKENRIIQTKSGKYIKERGTLSALNAKRK